ncbi:hypothetical protein CFN79_07835 [Chromobacterium vaccinii]|uniref:hypothetical protein n=1 Tax=Chromobacterium TaxID=535 RepID=UPI000CE9553E|nr:MULTISPECIES: hypothetical protein [Chromobacterium]AVG15780.1 hypothetical protein CFN79_07835 [Chromobacterium vaccinii]MBA8737396.1 hypothetical protein [Chromobacterium violaceum]
MTWVDVVDSAVKIGLGALIASVSSMLLAKQNHARDLEKEVRKRNRELLEEVAEQVEEFTSKSLLYWAIVGDHLKALNGLKDRSVGSESVKTAQKELFDSFHELTSAEAKLLLLGFKGAQEKLRAYGDVVSSMRKRFSAKSIEIDDPEIQDWRSKLKEARALFFDELSSTYKK